MAFCFAVVTLYSMIFGSDNSVAGVVFLLALLVLRQADFGIRTHHGLLCILGIFTILIVGPRVSNMVSPWSAFAINLCCIFLLMVLAVTTWLCITIQHLYWDIYCCRGTMSAADLIIWEWSDFLSECWYAWLYFIKISIIVLIEDIFWTFSENSIFVPPETGGISNWLWLYLPHCWFSHCLSCESHVGRNCLYVRLFAVFIRYHRTCQKERTV